MKNEKNAIPKPPMSGSQVGRHRLLTIYLICHFSHTKNNRNEKLPNLKTGELFDKPIIEVRTSNGDAETVVELVFTQVS